MNKQRIWIVKYRHGLSGPVAVTAALPGEAAAKGLAAYRYKAGVVDKWPLREVVEAVEPAANQASLGRGVARAEAEEVRLRGYY